MRFVVKLAHFCHVRSQFVAHVDLLVVNWNGNAGWQDGVVKLFDQNVDNDCDASWYCNIWKSFAYYWPFLKGMHWPTVIFPHEGPVMQNFDVFLVVSITSCWLNNCSFSDLRCQDMLVMSLMFLPHKHSLCQMTFLNTLRPRQIDVVFANAFSWMKMLEFRLRFHWNLFLRVELTVFQHWFR